MCRRYFSDANIVSRAPSEPCFPAALRWCWEQTESDYIFSTEDDWILVVDLALEDMLLAMERHPWLAALRLPKRDTYETTCQQSQSPKEPLYEWNGAYWQCPRNNTSKNGYYGSPSLLRGHWARTAAKLLDDGASPEKQLRRLRHRKHPDVWCWEYGIWSVPNTPRVIRDLGTKWRHARGINKNSQENFTRWT